MKYLCLRNCFVNARYHFEGRTYDLSTDFPIHEKNFSPVDTSSHTVFAPPNQEGPIALNDSVDPVDPVEVERIEEEDSGPPDEVNELACTVCGKPCKSKGGLTVHMKRKHKK